MINTRKIKGRMAELGLTQKDLTGKDALDCAQSTANQKLNGVRPIYLDEAERLGTKLKLTKLEFYDFFFCLNNCVMQFKSENRKQSAEGGIERQREGV